MENIYLEQLRNQELFSKWISNDLLTFIGRKVAFTDLV